MADHVTGFSTDVANSQFAGAVDPDAVMRAVFYVRACHNAFKSEKEGRPIYEDVIYCKYGPAGSTLLEMDVRSTSVHEQRFYRQWAMFKAGHDAETQKQAGTPIKDWPLLTPSAVEEIRGLKFYTIEQIAAASDEQLGRLGMGFMDMGPFVLRDRANAYLNAAKNSAFPMQQAAAIAQLRQEQEEKDAKHAAEIAELKAMILAQGTTKKRGRKPKAVQVPTEIQGPIEVEQRVI